MNEQRMRDIFAEELKRVGEHRLAEAVSDHHDNSNGGTAALAAMKRVALEVADETQDVAMREADA